MCHLLSAVVKRTFLYILKLRTIALNNSGSLCSCSTVCGNTWEVYIMHEAAYDLSPAEGVVHSLTHTSLSIVFGKRAAAAAPDLC